MSAAYSDHKPLPDSLYHAHEYPQRPRRDQDVDAGRSQIRLARVDDLDGMAAKPGTIRFPSTVLVEACADGSRLHSLDYAGLPLTREQYERHAILIGQTGSGKTYHFLYPMVAEFARETDHSMMLLNIKGPVATAELTAIIRRSRPGCRCIVFAPADPSRSSAYNLLAYARRHGMLDVLIRALEETCQQGSNESGYWRGTATRVFKAMLKYDSVQSLADAAAIIEDPSRFSEFVKQTNDPVLKSFLDFERSGSHNAMTNMADIANRLSSFAATPSTAAVTGVDCEFYLDNLLSGEEPFALIVEANESTFETEAPLLNLFFSLVFRSVTDVAERSPGNCLPRRLVVMLDEFGAIGKIVGFSRTINTGRSRGLSVFVMMQTLSQMSVYREEADSVLAGFGSKIFMLSGLAIKDRAYASSLAGRITVGRWRVSQSGDPVTGQWESATRVWERELRPLLTPEDLALQPHGVFGDYAGSAADFIAPDTRVRDPSTFTGDRLRAYRWLVLVQA